MVMLTATASLAQPNVLERVNALELKGQFKQASSLLTNSLAAQSLSPADRKTLQFELDRLARIKKDFPFTKDQLFKELQHSVKNITHDEFERWVAEGRFDTREIDDEAKFMTTSVSNLFFRYQELEPRRQPPKDRATLDKTHYEAVAEIKRAALSEKKPYVLPKRFRATMTVTAKPTAAPAGETIRAWLPIPREYPFQTQFNLLGSSSPPKNLEPATSPIRSISLEQPVRQGKPTEFKITYEFTKHGVYFAPDPSVVTDCPSDTALKPFTQESPHVVFTPELRALSKQIAGDETNACLKAKKFYDWIGGNIKYSYAIEYSTIRNISEYCRNRGYGDCGQEALLFIALCRLNGIPARWQSGWDTFPHSTTIHDWCEIYLAPYGWMPVDPYMSIYATRYATTLPESKRLEIRDFFFGGQDWYRIAANSDHSQQLTPPKRSMRSDDVDFQRGELEWGDHNIYFDQYSFALEYKEVKGTVKD
jgi:transglutaminase-like putative cysteine protease